MENDEKVSNEYNLLNDAFSALEKTIPTYNPLYPNSIKYPDEGCIVTAHSLLPGKWIHGKLVKN
jgi:hypothetical protein